MSTELTTYKIYLCALKYIDSRSFELFEQSMFSSNEEEKQHADKWLQIYKEWEDQIRELAAMEKMCEE